MGTYDLDIYQTAALATDKGRTPSYRFRDYVKEAFDHVANHSVNITIRTDDPQMYADDETDNNDGYANEQYVLDGNDSVSFPCFGGTTAYNGIGFYFEDVLACDGRLGEDDHTVFVLLTASHGGSGHTIIRSEQNSDHAGNFSISVVEGGYFMPDAPSSFTRYEPEDDSTAEGVALDAIQTGTHELGHAFMHDYPEGRVTDHEVGEVTRRSFDLDYHWTTPMGLNGGTDNECGDSYNRNGIRRWDVVWSECCQGYFQHPFK